MLIGWVDLCRGILLCDVLDESPKLHDMPLPMPAKGNWSIFLECCPQYLRDIVVNQSRDNIKYSKWSSERTHPRQMLVRVMSGWPAKDVQIAWSLVDGKPPHGACLSLSVHGMTGRLNALSVVSTLAKSLLMSERITS